MASVRRSIRSSQAVQGGVDYDPEKQGSGSVKPRPEGPKSKTPGTEQEGKQSRKNPSAGALSVLPDMPLDVLYDVSCRIVSIADEKRVM